MTGKDSTEATSPAELQQLTTKDGQPFAVPVEGSLGLLALGYRGLIAWRLARRRKRSTEQGEQEAG